jgi:RNA-directed DNA polymerase
VNGPEGEALAWLSIDWQRVEGDVRRLRQRIFTASRAGDLRKVRGLQKLMLRSRANALMAVRRVAEVNAGRMTAGIDGMTALGPVSKADLADWAQRRTAGWDPGRSSGRGAQGRRAAAPARHPGHAKQSAPSGCLGSAGTGMGGAV